MIGLKEVWDDPWNNLGVPFPYELIFLFDLIKWEQLKFKGKDVLPLSLADTAVALWVFHKQGVFSPLPNC